MENKSQASIKFKVDSKEIIYDLEASSLGDLEHVYCSIKDVLIDQKVTDVFQYSRSSLSNKITSNLENPFLVDKLLSLFRVELKKYRGEISPELIVSKKLKQELVCRCKALGYSQLKDAFIQHKGDFKKVYTETEISGVCGSCFSEVDKFLESLESNEGVLFDIPIEKWNEQVIELINEYYLVCPPDFSSLKFELVSISSRGIKLKCVRKGDRPGRMDIQDSLNNFFKGQLPQDLSISVFI